MKPKNKTQFQIKGFTLIDLLMDTLVIVLLALLMIGGIKLFKWLF
jgi:competence protein ComGC